MHRPSCIEEEIIFDALRYGFTRLQHPQRILLSGDDFNALINNLGGKVLYVDVKISENVRTRGVKIYIRDAAGYENELHVLLREAATV